MASFTASPCFSKAPVRSAGLGASARVFAIAAPHRGSAGAGPSVTGKASVSTASSGMQMSAQTRKAAAPLSVTVWPGLASAGAVSATGRSTSSS